MSDKELVIEMEDDTEGHWRGRGIVEPEETDWLEDRLRRDSGKTGFRITLGDEDDTEGHGGGGTLVRVNLGDDDDTEGHAIAIHFPSRAEADAFRRRLLVTGVLVGTVALGAAGGVGLSALQSDAGSAGSAGAATTQAGPMDVHEAPAFQRSAATSVDSDSDIGIMDASGAAAGTQAGPMDVHEAPAFQQSQASSSSAVDENGDIGIMDGSGASDDGGAETPDSVVGPR